MALRKGEDIQLPDGQSRGVYRLGYGLLGLRRKKAGGQNVFLRLIYPGEVFCVCPVAIGAATVAQAFMPSGVTLIGSGDAECETACGETLVDVLLREVERTEQRVVDLTTLTGRQFIARLLLEFSWLQGGGEGAFRIPIARTEMADMIGIRPESLARLLAWFVSNDVLELAGRRARILDRCRMQRIAGISTDDDKITD